MTYTFSKANANAPAPHVRRPQRREGRYGCAESERIGRRDTEDAPHDTFLIPVHETFEAGLDIRGSLANALTTSVLIHSADVTKAIGRIYPQS